jgi:hypothetical protein
MRTLFHSGPRPSIKGPALRAPACCFSQSPLPFSKPLSTTRPTRVSKLDPPLTNPHRAYYRTHGRALFKCLTLAFLTYQIVYWTWLTLETEEIKDKKNREIKGLEGEVRLLDEGRMSHLAKNREVKGMDRGG